MTTQTKLSTPQPLLPFVLIPCWALSMIMLPIIIWTIGETAMLGWLVGSVLLQLWAVLWILKDAWGWRQTIKMALIVIVGTLGIEIIGSSTGWPFGDYHYTALLQPQIAHVPILIPAAWLMMLPCAWAVATRYRQNLWQFALVSGLALTAWDLFLDPQMVHWGLWVWEQPGGYFGIPWLNYGGWFLTAFVLTWIIRPTSVPLFPLLFIYTVTWFLELFGLLLFWGLVGPALVGGIVMGFFMWLGWQNYWHNTQIGRNEKRDEHR